MRAPERIKLWKRYARNHGYRAPIRGTTAFRKPNGERIELLWWIGDTRARVKLTDRFGTETRETVQLPFRTSVPFLPRKTARGTTR